MASDNTILGIKEIKMGACGTNGVMGTALTTVGDIVPDSVALVFDEMTKTDIFCDDQDSVYISSVDKAVPRRVEFSIRDLSPANMIKAFGGTTVNGTRWEAPVNGLSIEQSVTLESMPVGGFKKMVYIPRGSVRASLDGKFQKKDSAAIKFIVDIVTPFNAGGTPLPSIYMDKIAG
jgi:hypothetical protein